MNHDADTIVADLFFFYGSLRRGYWNNRIIGPLSECLGAATTRDPFRLYISRFGTVPTCVPAPADEPAQPDAASPLRGEVWRLSAQDARSVFMLETGYLSGTFEVTLDATPDDLLTATIFHHRNVADCFYINGGPELIHSGDYSRAIGSDGGRVAA